MPQAQAVVVLVMLELQALAFDWLLTLPSIKKFNLKKPDSCNRTLIIIVKQYKNGRQETSTQLLICKLQQ